MSFIELEMLEPIETPYYIVCIHKAPPSIIIHLGMFYFRGRFAKSWLSRIGQVCGLWLPEHGHCRPDRGGAVDQGAIGDLLEAEKSRDKLPSMATVALLQRTQVGCTMFFFFFTTMMLLLF